MNVEINKMIAEFMGISVIESKNRQGEKYYYYNNADNQGYEALPDYNESWDDLMPVIEKIEKIGETPELYGVIVDICTTHIKIGRHSRNRKYVEPVVVDLKLTPIPKLEATYIAVVEFIEWYNAQNK